MGKVRTHLQNIYCIGSPQVSRPHLDPAGTQGNDRSQVM